MALVAYDYDSGSGSENEDESSTSASVIILNKTETSNKPSTELNHNGEVTEDTTTSNDLPELLSHLPQTRTSPTKIVEDDKLEDFIPKYQPTQTKEKKPQKVKITIPSLSEFKDDEEDEPQPKRQKTPSKNSGLLSILPPVRGSPLSTKSFVPHVLKNKQQPAEKASLVPNAVRKKAELVKKAAIHKITKISKAGSDVESDDDIEVPETFDDEMWQKVCGRRTKAKEVQVVEEVLETKAIDIAPEPAKPYEGLDNEAFKELVGKSKRPVNIKLIDIHEEELLPDANLWLTKSLTDPDQAPKPVVENPVDPTRKKKHHITYLAEQAKANEQELQSQWSSSKYVRNQTRAKYGF